MNKDSLGDRMKSLYENATRSYLPGRNYTIIRVDGKAFHTYTNGLKRPFDLEFVNHMNETARFLCANIQGAKFAFVQSDEISILSTDFDTLTSQAWFGGNVQKIVSISASLATAIFNTLRPGKLAMFDSRVFQISDPVEVENYFIWRQQDTIRNSISSVAQSLYSAKQLHGKNANEMQEMIFQKGINWNNYDISLKKGRLVVKSESIENRNNWNVVNPEIFTQDRKVLTDLVPKR